MFLHGPSVSSWSNVGSKAICEKNFCTNHETEVSTEAVIWPLELRNVITHWWTARRHFNLCQNSQRIMIRSVSSIICQLKYMTTIASEA